MTDALSPSFLLAGAARSGTTAVMEALRRHPDVFVTDPKEPHFLALGEGRPDFRGPGDDETVNRLAVTDADAYRALFRAGAGCRARGEGSVTTLYRAADSVRRMREFAPAAHVFVILRDPVHRAFSAHQYLRARGFEPLEEFEAALDAEPRRIADRWQHLWHYAAMGRYGEQLSTFVDELGPERITVLFHDDLLTGWDGVLGTICDRLGVEHRRGPAGPVNTTGAPRRQILQAGLRWPARHPRMRAVGRRLVPYAAWHRLRAANLAATEVPVAAEDRLRAGFADDLVRLRDLLDTMPASVPGRVPRWLADAGPDAR